MQGLDLFIKSEGSEYDDQKETAIKTEETVAHVGEIEGYRNTEKLIKTEEDEIKYEIVQGGLQFSQFPKEPMETFTVTETWEVVTVKSEFSDKNTTTFENSSNIDELKSDENKVMTNILVKVEPPSDMHNFKIHSGTRETKTLSNLNSQKSTDGNISKINEFECDFCDYITKTNWQLESHMLTHKDPSEIHWHQCEECDFKSKWKRSLKQHMMMHKTESEIEWFKCASCDHKFKRKCNLQQHILSKGH